MQQDSLVGSSSCIDPGPTSRTIGEHLVALIQSKQVKQVTEQISDVINNTRHNTRLRPILLVCQIAGELSNTSEQKETAAYFTGLSELWWNQRQRPPHQFQVAVAMAIAWKKKTACLQGALYICMAWRIYNEWQPTRR